MKILFAEDDRTSTAAKRTIRLGVKVGLSTESSTCP
jgi:hypothetical protein